MPEQWVVIQGDGVTYRHGAQAPLAHLEPFPGAADAETAAAIARAFLDAREGDDRKLVSGWLAVRWLTRAGWASDAFLFEWQAPPDDGLEVTPTGTSTDDWPLPTQVWELDGLG